MRQSAEEVGFGEGPPPNRGETWGGGCAHSSEFFLSFWLKIVHFGVDSDKNSQFSIELHHRIAC